MSVLQLAAAKTHLNITVSTWDTELQAVIDAAEAAVARRVGPLAAQEVTERVRGCRAMLTLSTLPVLSVTTLEDSAGSAVDPTLLYVDPAGLLEHASPASSFSSSTYTVVYEAGWSPLPDDVLLAVKEMVRHLWSTQRGGSVRPGSAPADGLANSLPGAAYSLPIRVQQLIDPYVPLGI